jgi:predicted DNA-binding helix-hairpin-helix protein
MSGKRLSPEWEQKHEEKVNDPKKQTCYKAIGRDAQTIRKQIEGDFEKKDRERTTEVRMIPSDRDLISLLLASDQDTFDTLALLCSLQKRYKLKDRTTRT